MVAPQERIKQSRIQAYTRLRDKGFRFIDEITGFPIALAARSKLQLFTPFLGCPPFVSVELHPDLIATVTPLKRGAAKVELSNSMGMVQQVEHLNPFDEDEQRLDLDQHRVSIITKLNCDFDVEAAVPRITICVWHEGATPVLLRSLRR